jgi:penicillin-binding protein A
MAALLFVARAATATPIDLDKLAVGADGVHARRGSERVLLTLDPELQRAMARLLAGSRAPEGAIVIADARTGRVLAWASVGDADHVRTPRFPAASLMKVVTAAAILEGGHAHRSTPQCFSGGVRGLSAEDVAKLCLPGEPRIAFGNALGQSINVVFGRLAAHRLDSPALREMAKRVAFDGDLPFDLGAPPSRIEIPDDALGRARAAAGFHRGAISPLAALHLMRTIAQKGMASPLRILDSSPPGDARRVLSESTAKALARMLEVTTTQGTSKQAFRPRDDRPKVLVAGKTGTLGIGRPHRLLSWFAGFAPARDPEIVIAVLLANELKWWRKANEVARDGIDHYFARKSG